MVPCFSHRPNISKTYYFKQVWQMLRECPNLWSQISSYPNMDQTILADATLCRSIAVAFTVCNNYKARNQLCS